jgi:hypothetical protein
MADTENHAGCGEGCNALTLFLAHDTGEPLPIARLIGSRVADG